MENKFKEFKPTSWSIDNKTSIYVLAIFLAIFGMMSYNSIPKEQFPEIVIPQYIVSTIYPGTSPADIENLVTRPLEKNLKGINGVKKITSSSVQDYSSIVVEFQTGIDTDEANQKVKDAVDKTKRDLPNDLLSDPSVIELNVADMPIMFINLSGNYPLDQLKVYADDLKERIEGLKQITRVELVGALEREIQVNLDMYKMQAANVSFSDVENKIKYENMTVSGGSIDMYGMRRAVRVVGEFKDIETIKNLIVKSGTGALVYLKDIAEVQDDFKERESFARLDGANVLTLNVIKKSGQNLLDASDAIKIILDEAQEKRFPEDLKISITADQSQHTRITLTDLNNTIIIGFILVTIVLMFFMGLTNALFVGLSVPLSMALAYVVMPGIGFTMNMLVMFAFIFALGIVVDDAIVVVENTHRVFKDTKMSIAQAAKFAAGEVFVPILSGTLTTLAPFFPLAFWPGVTGQFMFYIPVTLIITLFASLIVAYIINPVFAVSFMKHDEDEEKALPPKRVFVWGAVIMTLGVLMHLLGYNFIGNLSIIFALFYIFHNLYGFKVLIYFQKRVIPAILRKYEVLIRQIIIGRRPYWLIGGLVALLIATFVLVGMFPPQVGFFPENEPQNINVFIKMPVGTDVKVTDSIATMVEKRIKGIIGDNNPIVESVVTNVALGASESEFEMGIVTSNKAKISINFVEFEKRHGQSTVPYLDSLRNNVKDIAGAEIKVAKNVMGPPTGPPVNIEISGDDLDKLVATSENLIAYLDSAAIDGCGNFESDFNTNKPEVVVSVDRQRANMEGISVGQIGGELRTAIYGNEASKYRDGEDQYPIQIRYEEETRKNIDRILNHKITFMDMNTGRLRSIPLATVAKINYVNSYGGINRKNSTRTISVSTTLATGYTANDILPKVDKLLAKYEKSDDISIAITGETEDQQESVNFLSGAMIIALCMILFILITQFNSINKTLIIISEVFFSLIGVLLGYVFFGQTISIVMTGMGLVALAGIVVRNGILLVEFTDILKERGLRTREAIVQAGKTRITPVLLTATATILGLIPLAIGFNIDFYSLISEGKPHIFFGGDNVAFFGALSWTIIYGLTFATFLTLIFIPVMYYLMFAGQIWVGRKINRIRVKFFHH